MVVGPRHRKRHAVRKTFIFAIVMLAVAGSYDSRLHGGSPGDDELTAGKAVLEENYLDAQIATARGIEKDFLLGLKKRGGRQPIGSRLGSERI